MTKHITTISLAAVILAVPTLAAAAARAELRPRGELVVDTPAQLVITVDGERASPPPIRLRDADVQYSGQASKTTIVNGDASRETVFMYTVIPRKPGALEIPAVAIGTDETSPISARVVDAGTVAKSVDADRAREPRRAFIRIDTPTRTLHVGEAVPVKIRAYFRAGVAATLQGQPRIDSPAFTLGQLSEKPVQRETEIDGVPHLEVTWTAVLSPAKPTKDKVTIELPVEIAYREQRAPQRRSIRDLIGEDPFGADPFSDPFFDDPFGAFGGADPFAGFDMAFDTGPVRRQTVTLRHTLAKARIAELPEENKPAAFGGAVGQFELASELPEQELRVGEPVTLTIRAHGSGNFDRVALGDVQAGADWKVYPGKSSVELERASAVRGTKTFSYTLVPTRAGELETPSATFSFFDPEKRAYRTLETKPSTVTVAPAPVGTAAGGASTDPSSPAAGIAESGADGDRHSTLTPLIHRDGFWRLPGALLAITALSLLAAWARRSTWVRDQVRSRRVARQVRLQRSRLVAAARVGDAPVFFEAARRALQLRLAAEWGVHPETITAADVDSHLGERGVAIRDVFERADTAKYAPELETPTSLESWRAVVDAQLRNLEGTR